jgi:hypothetical protein
MTREQLKNQLSKSLGDTYIDGGGLTPADFPITDDMIELQSIGSVLDTHKRMCYAVMKDGEGYDIHSGVHVNDLDMYELYDNDISEQDLDIITQFTE